MLNENNSGGVAIVRGYKLKGFQSKPLIQENLTENRQHSIVHELKVVEFFIRNLKNAFKEG